MLQPVIPKGYNDPGDAGKSTAIFIGQMIKELASQLENL
ncbi:hypothetical protein B0G82_3558 [Paraburkholderia sp. BL17N1]|nr:hypothetical protein B0G82_3558 [Paraburkholderia sp. BL17N1]